MMRLSGPLKLQYAKENKLDANELLTASAYKETFRASMISWGEEKRNADSGYFCKLIEDEALATGAPVWVVTDARRLTDIEYFQQRYPALIVRVQAPVSARERRGWVFTEGVDDASSECALDGIAADVTLDSNDTTDADVAGYERGISLLIERIRNEAVKP
ncbi:hypothetical protein SARC_14453 [Sphaeroforma arctica JP610]|uniref:Phosphomevalonate kinase n=1 Tax=Sphaeroforma arctica JP610 TaxID=667725 RepID=A0A0L0F8E2_9EUKA|nr:hypothetical protein SARC_14453 [Sphaeroforma arctica JP610]KNC72985.1 hypothetical protein SARC_14453 [Sphaeroforma arctica JP610]|eukprot:XP_014146887.1 hypothetical protein SARC_14453 [Sphaeroforma arctica JP610]